MPGFQYDSSSDSDIDSSRHPDPEYHPRMAPRRETTPSYRPSSPSYRPSSPFSPSYRPSSPSYLPTSPDGSDDPDAVRLVQPGSVQPASQETSSGYGSRSVTPVYAPVRTVGSVSTGSFSGAGASGSSSGTGANGSSPGVRAPGPSSGARASGSSSGARASGSSSGARASGSSSGARASGSSSGARASGSSSGARASGSSSGARASGSSSGARASGSSSGAGTTGSSSGAGAAGSSSGAGATGSSSGAGATGSSSGAGATGSSSGSRVSSTALQGKRARKRPDFFVDEQAAEWEETSRRRKHKIDLQSEIHRALEPLGHMVAMQQASSFLDIDVFRDRVKFLEEAEEKAKESMRKLEQQHRTLEEMNEKNMNALTSLTDASKKLVEDNNKLRLQCISSRTGEKNLMMKLTEAERKTQDKEALMVTIRNAFSKNETTLTQYMKYIEKARLVSQGCLICLEDANPALESSIEDALAQNEFERKKWYALNCGTGKAHVVCDTCYNKQWFVDNPRCPLRCSDDANRNVRDSAVKLFW